MRVIFSVNIPIPQMFLLDMLQGQGLVLCLILTLGTGKREMML